MNRPGIPEPPTCHSRQAWFPKRESAQGSADPRLWFWSSANGCPVASQVGDSNRKRGVEMTDRSQGTPRHAEPRRTQQERLLETRALSLELARPLSPEDMTVQPMDDASPTKWHLAHVDMVLRDLHPRQAPPRLPDVRSRLQLLLQLLLREPRPRQPRPRRGVLTRPSCERVLAYRAHVDDGLAKLVATRLLSRVRDHAPDRGRHQPRAAASGAPAHRHPGAVCRQSAAAGISRRAAGWRRIRCRGDSLGRVRRRHLTWSGTRAPASPGTTRRRATTC